MSYIINFSSIAFVLSIIVIILNSIFSFFNDVAFSNWILLSISGSLLCCSSIISNYHEYKGIASRFDLFLNLVYPIGLLLLPIIFIYLNFVVAGVNKFVNVLLCALFFATLLLGMYLSGKDENV